MRANGSDLQRGSIASAEGFKEITFSNLCRHNQAAGAAKAEGFCAAQQTKMNLDRPFKILFLCTGNSARSIFAEYLIRRLGKGKFESFSAGANPRPAVNQYTIRVLRESYELDPSDAHPKSWDEYKDTVFDFVITLCDNANEHCPFWPGQPIIAHWPSPDPAHFKGTGEETYRHFWQVSRQIYRRIDIFCNLPFDKLDRLRLEHETKEIGKTKDY
jgi:arsenate reductase (thioredoxin)